MDTHHSQTKGLSERQYVYYFKNGQKALRDYYFGGFSMEEAFIRNGLEKPSDADIKWMKEQYIADERQHLINVQKAIENEKITAEQFRLNTWIDTSESVLLLKAKVKTKREYLETLWKFEDEQNEN